MGYLHDVPLSVVVPLQAVQFSGGSWSVVREASGQFEYFKDYGAESFKVSFPVSLPVSWGTKRGSRLASVDLFYSIKTADLTSLTAWIEQLLLPADGAAFDAPTTPEVALSDPYAANAVGRHRQTVSPASDLWLPALGLCRVFLSGTSGASPGFYYFGAKLNFIFRE